MSREENRKRFPITAGFVDMIRSFGAEVSVAYAKEGDYESGDRARFDEWDEAAAFVPTKDDTAIEAAKDRMYQRKPSRRKAA